MHKLELGDYVVHVNRPNNIYRVHGLSPQRRKALLIDSHGNHDWVSYDFLIYTDDTEVDWKVF